MVTEQRGESSLVVTNGISSASAVSPLTSEFSWLHKFAMIPYTFRRSTY